MTSEDLTQSKHPEAPDGSSARLSDALRRGQERDEKDLWDKLSSMSTFLSTVLVAIVGGVFTYIFNAREAKHQHNIQETQTVAQLMPYLTSKDEKQQRTALIAVKVLQDTSLMVNLAASDPTSPGARQALRDVAFNAAAEGDRVIAAGALRQFEFVPACTLPFQGTPISHPIDDSLEHSCGMFGSYDSDALKAQNFEKNNFCAGTESGNVAGQPEAIDFDKLNKLQAQVANGHSINWGDQNDVSHFRGPTTNRDSLKQLGEGKLVVLQGFVHSARQEGAESVNCGVAVPNEPDYHDIHISLVQSADERDECNAIVAEMSPHHRPPEWIAPNLNELAQARLPVRVTGQLFFDSSHEPCANKERVRFNPKRSSLWEIHPIYKFEVCTLNCDREGTWKDFAAWLKGAAKTGE